MIPPVAINFPDDPFGPAGPAINQYKSALDPATGADTAAAPDLTDPPVAAAVIPFPRRVGSVDPGPCGFSFVELRDI